MEGGGEGVGGVEFVVWGVYITISQVWADVLGCSLRAGRKCWQSVCLCVCVRDDSIVEVLLLLHSF